MENTKSRAERGVFNSSITRCWPIFQQLLERDPTGRSWLGSILGLAPEVGRAANLLAVSGSRLRPSCSEERPHKNNVLKGYGLEQVTLPGCLERRIPPPEGILRWLIRNPGGMTWPKKGRKEYGEDTQHLREKLVGQHGPVAQRQAMAEAEGELGRLGPEGSLNKWWAFEGFTVADCSLETDEMLLLIEGKRTETLSPATSWYPQRNQLVRNLEVAQAQAGSRFWAVLMMAEDDVPDLTSSSLEDSLPHLSVQERQDLNDHYLGAVTWRSVCEATGLDFQQLPNTTQDYVDSLAQSPT